MTEFYQPELSREGEAMVLAILSAQPVGTRVVDFVGQLETALREPPLETIGKHLRVHPQYRDIPGLVDYLGRLVIGGALRSQIGRHYTIQEGVHNLAQQTTFVLSDPELAYLGQVGRNLEIAA